MTLNPKSKKGRQPLDVDYDRPALKEHGVQFEKITVLEARNKLREKLKVIGASIVSKNPVNVGDFMAGMHYLIWLYRNTGNWPTPGKTFKLSTRESRGLDALLIAAGQKVIEHND